MKILFTGASSFSGMWFVRELVKAGHRVTATLLRPKGSYRGIRRKRVEILSQYAELIEECPFGSKCFIDLIDSGGSWDLLCHHASEVSNYKSPSFDYLKAVENNCHNLETVIDKLLDRGCKGVLLTGTLFEQKEGIGSDNLRAVSPYGLSKGITSDIFEYFCQIKGITLGKFVVPNPFGPYEEERFIAYLMKTWLARECAEVLFPDYIRDNIHISLLALCYVSFVATMMEGKRSYIAINPSGYIATQGAFTEVVAGKIRERSSLPCEVKILTQKEFLEPIKRVNSDTVEGKAFGWCEEEAWDQLWEYYRG